MEMIIKGLSVMDLLNEQEMFLIGKITGPKIFLRQMLHRQGF
jgi:hypothetical protein